MKNLAFIDHLDFSGSESCNNLPIKVEIETGHPIHILEIGKEANVNLILTNQSTQDREITITMLSEDFAKDKQNFQANLHLPAQAEINWWPDNFNLKPGIFWLSIHLTDQDASQVTEIKCSFAYMQPARIREWNSEPFQYGVCGGSRSVDDEKEYELNALAAETAGYSVVRGDIYWDTVEPEEDNWCFEHYDKKIEAFYRHGIEMQVLLAYNTKWAVPENIRNTGVRTDWLFAPPDLEKWLIYVGKVVKRYKEKVRFWEVWNETDIVNFWPGTYEQYLELLKATYKKIKSIDPNAQVLTSGFATLFPHNGRKDHDFQIKLLQDGQNHFDIHAHHEHGIFGNFRWVVDGPLKNAREKLTTNKPLYFNETAINSKQIGERGQASVMVRKLAFARSRGAMGYTWYNLRGKKKHHWGVVTKDYFPRAVFVAHNNLVNQLRDLEFKTELDFGKDRCGFIFGKDDKQVLVAWHDRERQCSEPILLEVGQVTSAQQIDIMGGIKELPICSGQVLLEIPAVPIFLSLTGLTQDISLSGNLLTAQAQISNAKDIKLDFSANAPLTLSLPNGKKLNLQQGESKTEIQQMTDKDEITIPFQDAQNGRQGTITIPLEKPIIISANTDQNRDPDIVLDQYKQVVNLCDNVPQLDYLMWRGAFDLSAKIWLALIDNSLQLKIEVMDNEHVQPYSGAELFKGDSVQLALGIPEQAGYWELGFAQGDDGSPKTHIWHTPEGCALTPAELKLTTERTEDPDKGNPERACQCFTYYNISIPLPSLGISSQNLKKGFRMNILINDNDNNIRKGWINLAPGLGFTKEPNLWPFIFFE